MNWGTLDYESMAGTSLYPEQAALLHSSFVFYKVQKRPEKLTVSDVVEANYVFC